MEKKSNNYQIILRGSISEDMSESLAGMDIQNERLTILTGEIKDQSELMGVLNTLSNRLTEVVSVKKIDGTIDYDINILS